MYFLITSPFISILFTFDLCSSDPPLIIITRFHISVPSSHYTIIICLFAVLYDLSLVLQNSKSKSLDSPPFLTHFIPYHVNPFPSSTSSPIMMHPDSLWSYCTEFYVFAPLFEQSQNTIPTSSQTSFLSLIFFYHNPLQCLSQLNITLLATTVKLQSNLPPRASTTTQKLSPDPHTLLEPLPSLSPPYLHFTPSFMKRSKKEREWYFLCFLMIIQHKITVGKTSLPKRSVVHNIIDHSPWLSSKSEFTSESIQRYTE